MHRSDFLTISDFLACLFTFTFNTTGIRYICVFTIIPTQNDCRDRFTMHIVDPLILNGCAIKMDVLQCKMWPDRYRPKNNSNYHLIAEKYIVAFSSKAVLGVGRMSRYRIYIRFKTTFGSGSDRMRKKSDLNAHTSVFWQSSFTSPSHYTTQPWLQVLSLPIYFIDLEFPESMVPTIIRKQLCKLVWLDLQLSSCG